MSEDLKKKKSQSCSHNESVEADSMALYSVLYRALRENEDLRQAYSKLLNQTVKALLKCLEQRDPYTYGHSMRVMEYTMLIGRSANLKESGLSNLELAALFHDIGKVGIPDCVLLKPERLNEEEKEIIQTHPVKSGEVISIIDAFKNVVPGIVHHHERIDGKGYPGKLAGKEIPLESRIILVADTFDAMTSSRPYRKALPIEEAYAELEKYSGTQFDPEFVKIFLEQHQKLYMLTRSKTKLVKKAA